MGLIPRAFLDELLSQTDIVSFIDGYVPLKKQGTSFAACCPFHQEKTPSFNVIPKKQFYHCFGCGVSGNAISFAMSYLNQGFSEAVETLATRMGLTVPREGETSLKLPSLTLYQLLSRVTQFYQTRLQQPNCPAQAYLSTRGVNAEMIERYQLGYAPDGWHALQQTKLASHQSELITSGMLIQKETGGTYDRYRDRLMFPIHDRQGRIIGFGGRSLHPDQKPKYLNSPETVLFQKNRELYGLHQILQHDTHPSAIIIVEGYMDVIALAQMGILSVVATLGTATSTYHVQLLSKHTSHLIFCFDGDAAGQQAAWRALENTLPALASNLHASFIFLPEEHDPDSFVREKGADVFRQKMQQAIPLHQLLLNTLCASIDVHHISGKNQLIHQIKPYLTKIPEGPYKQLLFDEITRLTHIELHRIMALLTESPTTIATHQEQPIKRTPLRIATALILQHPELYAKLSQTYPPIQFSAEHYTVLRQLMEHIVQQPDIHTASLIEFFRDTPRFEALNRLATWDHLVPEHALAQELRDIIHFLSQKNQATEIEQLLQRSKQQGLDTADRARLQDLLQKKHQPIQNH